jgi:hypothetical protein
MIHDLQNQQQVEMWRFNLAKIRQLELEPVIGPGFGHFDGVGRDIVSVENASRRESQLELPKHFSGPAAHLANGLGVKVPALQHAMDVLGLGLGEFHVPGGIPFQVLTVDMRVGRRVRDRGKPQADVWPFEYVTLMAR